MTIDICAYSGEATSGNVILSTNPRVTTQSNNTPTGSGGYYYSSYSYEDELEEKREKAKHPTFVREAAVEAVTSNYYGTQKAINDLAIQKLKIIASDLQFKISKTDLELLKAEVNYIKAMREIDDEENWMMLQ